MGKSLKQTTETARERKTSVKIFNHMVKRLISITISESRRGRQGISSLTRPKKGFRIDRAKRASIFFETIEKSRSEDRGRAGGLGRARQLSKEDQAIARVLVSELKRGAEQLDPPPSLASSLFMREVRIRVTGAVWQLHNELDHLPRSVFTIIPRGYWLTPEELAVFDVPRAMRALWAALYRAGARDATGGLILFLHGEWDEGTGRYQLHLHGWAAGGMVEVVNALRRQRAFISTKAARVGDVDGVRNRVVVSRKIIRNPAYRISYLVQSFWPSRATGVLAETVKGKGGKFRVRGKRRISEPRHSQSLRWLHQWRLEDVSLLVGLQVAKRRLQLNTSKATYTNWRE